MNKKLKNLSKFLKQSIIGQDHVIDTIAPVLLAGELGLCDTTRPKGSFLFVGPTGTGKTQLTVAFTQYLLGENNLARFDMSEYMHKDALGKFLGQREGEVGILGDKLNSMNHGTLLFDEMEKADPQILDLFLQILDCGRITLANKKTYLLNNFYIVFTSNIGSWEINEMADEPFSRIERIVLREVAGNLRPELVGRIDEKLVFKSLDYDTQLAICKMIIEKEINWLKKLGHEISISKSAMLFLMRVGFSRNLGARPMRNAIGKHLKKVISDQMLRGKPTSGVVFADSYKTSLFLKTSDQKCA